VARRQTRFAVSVGLRRGGKRFEVRATPRGLGHFDQEGADDDTRTAQVLTLEYATRIHFAGKVGGGGGLTPRGIPSIGITAAEERDPEEEVQDSFVVQGIFFARVHWVRRRKKNSSPAVRKKKKDEVSVPGV